MKFKLFALLALISLTFTSNSQTEMAERNPLVVMYTGTVDGKVAELFLSANYMGAVGGYFTYDGVMDSLRYGAYEEEGKVSLNLLSGKEIEGTHKDNKTVKFKLIDGKEKTKFNLTAVTSKNNLVGTYKAKDAKFSARTGMSCHLFEDGRLFVNASWETADFQNGFGSIEGVATKTNETSESIFYTLVISKDEKRPEFNQTAYIEFDKKSGEMNLFVESNLPSLLGPIKSGEKVYFIKR